MARIVITTIRATIRATMRTTIRPTNPENSGDGPQFEYMKFKASIIILDFFKSKRVIENVKSILSQKTDFQYEIIIVDNSANPLNAKKLEPLKKYPNVKIFINEKNIGYVLGNNQGVNRSKGEYILIVNPDIIWPNKNTFQKLLYFGQLHVETVKCYWNIACRKQRMSILTLHSSWMARMVFPPGPMMAPIFSGSI